MQRMKPTVGHYLPYLYEILAAIAITLEQSLVKKHYHEGIILGKAPLRAIIVTVQDNNERMLNNFSYSLISRLFKIP